MNKEIENRIQQLLDDASKLKIPIVIGYGSKEVIEENPSKDSKFIVKSNFNDHMKLVLLFNEAVKNGPGGERH